MDDLLRALTTTVAKRGQVELDYAWRNPGSGKIANEQSVLRKVEDLPVGVG